MLRLSAVIIGVGLALPVWAGGLQVKDYQGAPYVSGGVGQEEQQALQAMERRFNLKVVFAAEGGAYLSAVGVVIRNQHNNIVLQAESEGPWLYATLPAGSYTVQAISAGKAIEQRVEVGKKALSETVLRW